MKTVLLLVRQYFYSIKRLEGKGREREYDIKCTTVKVLRGGKDTNSTESYFKVRQLCLQ